MPPPSMKKLNIKGTRVTIDVAAIEWPANATALVYEGGTLVCRFTDPDESKEGAETGEFRIVCRQGQVIGTSSAVLRNEYTYEDECTVSGLCGQQPRTLPHPSVYPFSPLRFPFSSFLRRCRQDRTSRRNAERVFLWLLVPHRYG